MRRVAVRAAAGVPPAHAAVFADALAERRTLADVLAWLRRLVPERRVTAIVTQDEYTHDVVVGWDDETWLVFDTN